MSKENYCSSINCGYYYKEEGEKFPHCHFEGPVGWAPCEYDDYYIEPEDDDYPDDYYDGWDE